MNLFARRHQQHNKNTIKNGVFEKQQRRLQLADGVEESHLMMMRDVKKRPIKSR